MSDVVNGPGTAGRAKLPIENVLMAGKTGTAQVVGLNIGGGKGGQWKYRDHGLFIFFAPFDKPRYAGAVVIEHGGGSGAAYPIARDVMTFLFDPAKGMEALHELEKQLGRHRAAAAGGQVRALRRGRGHRRRPAPVSEARVARAVDAERAAPTPTAAQTGAASPAARAGDAGAHAAAPTPAASAGA